METKAGAAHYLVTETEIEQQLGDARHHADDPHLATGRLVVYTDCVGGISAVRIHPLVPFGYALHGTVTQRLPPLAAFEGPGAGGSGIGVSLSVRSTNVDLLWRIPGIRYRLSRNRRS